MLKEMQRLQSLGARVRYSDTDSIIFDVPKSVGRERLMKEFNIGCKSYGAFKFEVKGEILSCIVAGPKNYAIRYKCAKTGKVEEMVKVRGFTLTNPCAKEKLNHDSMKEILLKWWVDETLETVETENFTMKVDRKTQSVKNATVVKKYRIAFDKRWIDPESKDRNSSLCTIPFGAKHLSFSDLPFPAF